jgi:hypothetical protein
VLNKLTITTRFDKSGVECRIAYYLTSVDRVIEFLDFIISLKFSLEMAAPTT